MTKKVTINNKEYNEGMKQVNEVEETKLDKFKGYVKDNYKIWLVTGGTFLIGYGAGKLVKHELVKHYPLEEQEDEPTDVEEVDFEETEPEETNGDVAQDDSTTEEA